MRPVDPECQAAREARIPLMEIPILWVSGKDRNTGAIQSLGLWGGDDDERIVVEDLFVGARVSRYFYGRGAVLSLGPIRHERGLTIRPVQVRLSPLADAAQQAFLAYEPRGAEAQVWKRTYDARTGKPIGYPERAVKGYINTAPIVRPEPGGEATLTAEIVSTARMLTVTSALVKSNARQLARAPGDDFRKYKTTMAQIEVPFGTESKRWKS